MGGKTKKQESGEKKISARCWTPPPKTTLPGKEMAAQTEGEERATQEIQTKETDFDFKKMESHHHETPADQRAFPSPSVWQNQTAIQLYSMVRYCTPPRVLPSGGDLL